MLKVIADADAMSVNVRGSECDERPGTLQTVSAVYLWWGRLYNEPIKGMLLCIENNELLRVSHTECV